MEIQSLSHYAITQAPCHGILPDDVLRHLQETWRGEQENTMNNPTPPRTGQAKVVSFPSGCRSCAWPGPSTSSSSALLRPMKKPKTSHLLLSRKQSAALPSLCNAPNFPYLYFHCVGLVYQSWGFRLLSKFYKKVA